MSEVIDPIIDDLKSIIEGLVVKKQHVAIQNETILSKLNFDYYYLAYFDVDTFESYAKFDIDILENMGYSEDEIITYRESKYNIPVIDREAIMQLQAQKNLDTFEETNNYYRSLIGLPDMDDFDLYIKNVENVSSTTPVHELSASEIYIANVAGAIDILKNEYPDKKYLNFLGFNKLDLFNIRNATRWDILKTGTAKNNEYIKLFKKNYRLSRDFVIDSFYDASRSVGEYENFIGFMILVNAFNMCMAEFHDIMINKKYSDDLLLHLNLQSYNYFDEFKGFPLNYKKRISDNIVNLIRNKGSDDIYKIIASDIFGLYDLDIFKVKIVKEHKRDTLGNPVFPVINQLSDYEDKFNLFFLKINSDKDISVISDVRDITNTITYEELTNSDPYWGRTTEEEDEIKTVLYTKNKNIFNSKYIKINNAYDLSALNFEMSYVLNFLFSIKDKIDDIEIYVGDTLNNQKIFNVLILLFATLSRYADIPGNIITDVESISTIKRFNVEYSEQDLQDLYTKYRNHNLDISKVKLNRFDDNENVIQSDIVNAFYENKELYDYLIETMNNSDDLDTVLLCSSVLDLFFTSKQMSNIFKKFDNTVATTYMDYLHSEAPELEAFLVSYADEYLMDLITNLWSILENSIDSQNRLKNTFLNMPSGSTNIIFNYLLKTLNVFKDRFITIANITSTYKFDEDNIKIVDNFSIYLESVYNETDYTDVNLSVNVVSFENNVTSIYDEIIIETIT